MNYLDAGVAAIAVVISLALFYSSFSQLATSFAEKKEFVQQQGKALFLATQAAEKGIDYENQLNESKTSVVCLRRIAMKDGEPKIVSGCAK
jgi:hypothetical protein